MKVRDGVLGKTHTHYAMPPAGHQNFGQRQIDVHGITRRMIDGADGWDLMLPRLEAFAGDLPLVAHNVRAERTIIRQTTEAAGLALPDFTYYCTQRAAQLQIPEQGPFRLNVLVERLGLPPLQHHDAGEDAAAAAHLAVCLSEITGLRCPRTVPRQEALTGGQEALEEVSGADVVVHRKLVRDLIPEIITAKAAPPSPVSWNRTNTVARCMPSWPKRAGNFGLPNPANSWGTGGPAGGPPGPCRRRRANSRGGHQRDRPKRGGFTARLWLQETRG